MARSLKKVIQQVSLKINPNSNGNFLDFVGTEKLLKRAKLIDKNITIDEVEKLYDKYSHPELGLDVANFKLLVDELCKTHNRNRKLAMDRLLNPKPNDVFRWSE